MGKWRKLPNDQTMVASELKRVFEAASIHFKTEGNVLHGILSNMP
jgi:hypothetical protein